jgi:uncharacterized membrane protein
MNSKDITLTIIFASLYAIGVIILAPISFSIYQVRIADALLPLSMIFGMPSALGLGLGAVVANIYGGFGIIDIVGGSAANFVACMVAWWISRRNGFTSRFLGAIAETVTITVIVGGYLSLIFQVPVEYGLFGILIGSIIAINVLGFLVEETLRRSNIIKRLV